MKATTRNFLFTLAIAASALVSSVGTSSAADLSESDAQFLKGYEKILTALAADDLTTAKKEAANLHEAGADLAKSTSLADARVSFGKMSETAEKLVAGKPGFYVAHCPMVNKDWVQTSKTVTNPFAGKEMSGCGEIKK